MNREKHTQPDDLPCFQLTEQIIGAAIAVHRELGPGFLESIYENALAHELSKQGLAVEQQKSFPVHYDGQIVGQHRLDLLVENQVLVELKAVDALAPTFTAQVISSLKVTRLPVGLLINFNVPLLKKGIRRFALTRQGDYRAHG